MDATDRMLTLREICEQRNTSPPTVYRLIAKGLLPAGERIGLRSVRWRESVIDAAYAALNAGRACKPMSEIKSNPLVANGDVSDMEAAATWLAAQVSPPTPVIPGLRQLFGLSAIQACEVAARAFELRTAR